MPATVAVHRRHILLAGLALALTPGFARAQSIPVGDPLEEYLRVLSLLWQTDAGAVEVRPSPRGPGSMVPDSIRHPWGSRTGRALRASGGGDPRVVVSPGRARAWFNSGYPWGGNDGAVWQGKGLTTAADVEATLIWGPLTVTVNPTVIYNQNRSFPLAPVTREGASPYGYPWRRIDLPQRFGPDPYGTLDPGQSTARLTWRGVTAGFGTENLWWGPGVENAILMSDNAPGFPHAFLATSRPANIGIGTVDAQWIWGRLQSSDWADVVPDAWYDQHELTRQRFITGAVVSFRPRGLSWVTVGATRVYTQLVPRGGLGRGEYFLVFQQPQKSAQVNLENPTGDDTRDQLLSIFARWAKPGSGFEAYVEWARDDHAWDLGDFLREPEHSQGYTLGARQALSLSGDRILSIGGELTHLQRASTSAVRSEGTYYQNGSVPEGYTQRGQIIGAAVGPGGDGQRLGVDLFAPWGRAGLFVQRQVRDNDAYYDVFPKQAGSFAACCHDVQVTGGFRSLWLLDEVDLGVDAAVVKGLTRWFVEGDDPVNLNLGVSIRFHRRTVVGG